MSSTIIGGNLKCYHGIDTADIDEWNEHCSKPENGHTESGVTKCIDCGVSVVFENIPYHPITPTGKNIQLRCPGCYENYINNHGTNTVKVIEDNENITMPSTDQHPQQQNNTEQPQEEVVQQEEPQKIINESDQQLLKNKFTPRGKML